MTNCRIKSELILTNDRIERVTPLEKRPMKEIREFMQGKRVIKNAIESESSEPKPTEIYTVRDKQKVISQFTGLTSINKAIIECNRHPGAYVEDKNGAIVHNSTMKILTASIVRLLNSKITLNSKPIYKNSTSSDIKFIGTGVYYIGDDVPKNGRYRIKKDKDFNVYLGYVNAEDID